MTTDTAAGDELERFCAQLRQALDTECFLQLRLGKYRGREPGLKQIQVRRLQLRGAACLSFQQRYATKDVTQNVPLAAGVAALREQLAAGFKSAELCTTTATWHLEFNNKGEPRLRAGATPAAAAPPPPVAAHDRAKRRLIDPASPFLRHLGVTNEQHQVLPSMAKKWKQINVFVELLRDALAASPVAAAQTLRVVDFGAGKGYLTFATYAFLRQQLGDGVTVTGIEAREELARFCAAVARQTGMAKLEFVRGDLASHAPAAIDILIALHACDTATDLALHTGIQAGAAILLCAPCCHQEIRPQMVNPPVLQPLLRFGIQQAQEAEMLTDSLRVLLLEAVGYEAKLFEFVSPEHTGKNKMILAIRRPDAAPRAAARAEFQALKAFYGIRQHTLETLLRDRCPT